MDTGFRLRDAIGLAMSIAICGLAGAIGSVFTVSAIPTWYASLEKPPLTPPNWLFAPVWTTLYVFMGVSAFLIWREGLENRDVKGALALFATKLILNASWAFVFFGLESITGGLVVILILWLATLLTTIWFFRVSAPAAWLLIPYLAWVSFASYLNLALLLLNY